VRRQRHPGYPLHPHLVALGQELDDRNPVADDQPVCPGDFDPADQGLLDGRQEAEKDECDDDRKKRQQGPQLLPPQIAPDQGQELHRRASA